MINNPEILHTAIESNPIKIEPGQEFSAKDQWNLFMERMAGQPTGFSVSARLEIKGIGVGEMRVGLTDQRLPQIRIKVNHMDEITSSGTMITGKSDKPIFFSAPIPYGENIEPNEKTADTGYTFQLDPTHYDSNKTAENVEVIKELKLAIMKDNSSQN